jgi:cytochrome c biogenesis protein CcmG, thiol:disulfide interchange protein DsbE
MKTRGAILIVLLAAAVTVAFMLTAKESPEEAKGAFIGRPAPQFELENIQGGKIKLSDLSRRVVLVNFWATWCDTCKEEAASLQRLADDEKFRTGLSILKILYRDSRGNAERYMKEHNIRLTVLLDDKRSSLYYGITGVPETFIISKDGILKYKFIGPVRWDSPEIRGSLSRLISGE